VKSRAAGHPTCYRQLAVPFFFGICAAAPTDTEPANHRRLHNVIGDIPPTEYEPSILPENTL
jgi:hypothetical protein